MTKKKAFTLVELLVVIAIVAILAVAGVVGYTVFIDKARISNAETELHQIKTLITTEAMSNPAITITEDEIVFGDYYYCTEAIGEEYAVGAMIDQATFATLTSENQAKFVHADIKTVAKYSDDEELQKVWDNLSYNIAAKEVWMISSSDSGYRACWTIADNTVKGEKIR